MAAFMLTGSLAVQNVSAAQEKPGMITDGNFETGAGWQAFGANVKTGGSGTWAHTGDGYLYPWRTGAYFGYKTVSVQKNTDYTLTFWYRYDTSLNDASGKNMVAYQVYAKGVTLKNNSWGAGKDYALIQSNPGYDVVPVIYEWPHSDSWKKVTAKFNPKDNDEVTVCLGNANTDGQKGSHTLYIDDVVMTPVYESFANGDFEIGNLDGWSVNAAEYFDGETRTAMLKDVNEERISSVKQKVLVEPNKEYAIKYSYKNVSGGHKITVCNQENAIITTQKNENIEDTWSDNVLRFNPGDNDCVIIEASNLSYDGETYLDDFDIISDKPVVDEACVLGYVAEGKNLYAVENGITSNGDTVNSYLYQWQESADGGNTWTDIADANTNKYQITDVTKKYRVGIAPVGELFTGEYTYSKEACITTDDFRKELGRVIDANTSSAATSEQKSYLRKLDMIDFEYGSILTVADVSKWDTFRALVSRSAEVSSVDVFCGTDSTGVDIWFDGRVEKDLEWSMHIMNAKTDAQLDSDHYIGEKVTYDSGTYFRKIHFTLPTDASVNDVYYSLGNIRYDFEVGKKVIVKNSSAVKNENTLTVTAQINNVNISIPGKKYDVFAAVYSAQGVLIGAARKEVVVDKYGSVDFEHAFTIDKSESENAYVRMFVWDASGMNPYNGRHDVPIK